MAQDQGWGLISQSPFLSYTIYRRTIVAYYTQLIKSPSFTSKAQISVFCIFFFLQKSHLVFDVLQD